MADALKEGLIKKIDYLPRKELELLKVAFDFAEEAHDGQKRATGEPYITHPIAVCEILLAYHADITTLISALLHDVVEDTSVPILEIDRRFGERVAEIVEGLTKVEKGKVRKEEYSAINTEKLLFASVKDIRVAAVKIADRLHNMRTLAVKRVEKKVPYANETLIFFSPLAEKLGLYKLQEELEELGFSYLNPPKFKNIKTLMNNYSNIFTKIYNNCAIEIMKEGAPFITELKWTKVPLYQSYSLLQEEHDLADLFFINVITKSKMDCYTALGVIHKLYKPSLHQMVDNIAIEISPFLKQINTKVLINNIEVHFIIKSEKDREIYDAGVFGLLRNGLTMEEIRALSGDLLGDSIHAVKSITNTPIEFEELISFELLQREMTVFTPKMDVIALPEGSTIIDFAFSLNPQIARKMSNAKVNGEWKPIHTVVHDMDIVEICTTSKEMVSFDWLNYAQTSKAYKAISELLKIQ
ncbi:GTP pyrophosphokinase [Lederbergia galactosidilyticus]|uniref:HD domain-containing protein n=1 Tax=Lederbergia galactosidilytica TaxID=217031 RepID=UPI001AE8845A|nr:GTP pyrophosphokinase [Lederbergia galactosidilytica]